MRPWLAAIVLAAGIFTLIVGLASAKGGTKAAPIGSSSPEITIPIAVGDIVGSVEGTSFASSVYVSVCGTGITASSSSFGGGIATGESQVCELLRVASVLDAMGDRPGALLLVKQAVALVDPTRTAAQRVALWLRGWVLEPLFSMIPWVGTSAY